VFVTSLQSSLQQDYKLEVLDLVGIIRWGNGSHQPRNNLSLRPSSGFITTIRSPACFLYSRKKEKVLPDFLINVYRLNNIKGSGAVNSVSNLSLKNQLNLQAE
jgi:hypothetical protein